MKQLSGKHEKTLKSIFAHPVPANISFADVASLLIALGADMQEREGSRVRFILQGRMFHTHKPHPKKEMGKMAIHDVREFLEGVGIRP
ncbi:MAG: type II toxin-antitoxin system HicA family toxin [Candidatus Omnitrophota bacterium]|jgi:hypothetical protein|nr:MAG: type II toxin-antitoxin system HicA family toxin [Candidatus Omnitrophota bacterium]